MSIHSLQTQAAPGIGNFNYKRELEESIARKKRIPVPSHRHAAPSAPWPWIDISDDIDIQQLNAETPPIPPLCDHKDCGGCWKGYPQSRFPNWTDSQQERAKIINLKKNYNRHAPCRIYHVDVNNEGFFMNADSLEAKEQDKDETWQKIVAAKNPENNRVRALFIENLTGPVMQMLGAKYNIEPFFYSASLNWIPSRYQEDPQYKKGDHITICVTFLKSVERDRATGDGGITPPGSVLIDMERDGGSTLTEQMIDTQAPLKLRSSRRKLVLDLLSVHLIRNVEGSTIISYHPHIEDHPTTEAKYLHERIRYAGQSVYWQKMFQTCPDPTFVLLTFIWHTIYAWDQALQDLYIHICSLEANVIQSYDIVVTQELHVIRAHLLYYSSLLEDLKKTIEFVRDTRNPAMDSFPEDVQNHNTNMMKRECANLVSEIDRLEHGRSMQDKRLKNVMNLVFSSVNIDDSQRMQKMTEAAVKDSAAMKQIAYLTMIFLPASFIAAVFGMNVKEFADDTKGTLGHYVGTALSLTAATIWIIIAFQSKWMYKGETSVFVRLGWPFKLIFDVIRGELNKKKSEEDEVDPAFPLRRSRLPVFSETLRYDASRSIDLEQATLDGGILVKTLVLSIDPYLREKMRSPDIESYTSAYIIGEPISCLGVGLVLRSETERFRPGDHIYGSLPHCEYNIIQELDEFQVLVNMESLPWSTYVGVAGMPGQTAYFGWKEYSAARKGDVVFVTTGAGPVGSLVIQLAKQEGLKVIASAGSDEKVKFMKEIGADVAFNYKTTKTDEVLSQEGPVDIYWDNVGGETLDAALRAARTGARFIECGMISGYNSNEKPIYNLMEVIRKGIKLYGFFVDELESKYLSEFHATIPSMIASGEIKYLEDVTEGLENVGKAMADVFEGRNLGKAVVRVAAE